MNYLDVVEEIIAVLKSKDEYQLIRLINNAKLKGGTGGEILAIICSLLKVYEKEYYNIFIMIEKQAKLLFKLSKEYGMRPVANYDLLTELD
jgi:predicted ribonuclease YlaK